MWLSVAGLTLRHNRMLTAMTEGTGECLMFGHCFLHLCTNFLVTWHTKIPWRCQCIINFKWMMGRMATQTVTGHLFNSMRFVTTGTIGDLAMYLMAESTGLLGMGTLIIGKILAWFFMACKACLFYITSHIQGKRFVGIGMTAQAVFQLIMGFSLMAHGAFRDDIFSPGRMLSMTIKTGNCCLVLAAITGN